MYGKEKENCVVLLVEKQKLVDHHPPPPMTRVDTGTLKETLE